MAEGSPQLRISENGELHLVKEATLLHRVHQTGLTDSPVLTSSVESLPAGQAWAPRLYSPATTASNLWGWLDLSVGEDWGSPNTRYQTKPRKRKKKGCWGGGIENTEQMKRKFQALCEE
jgi:hypothetical protein